MVSNPSLPALDPLSIEPRTGSSYPDGFRDSTEARIKRRLGDAVGLEAFGINLVHLPPGSASALRHWHSHEDEFVYVLEGDVTLVTDAGEQVLGPGMTAGFPAGREDGHHLVNRGAGTVVYLEIGSRSPDDEVAYPDNDLAVKSVDGQRRFTNRAGKPY